MTTNPTPKQKERARRIVQDVMDLYAQGTSQSPTECGPPFGPPWYIIDASKAEPEVNNPGELVAEVDENPSDALLEARAHVVAQALAEAERRGAEAAAQWCDHEAAACLSDIVDGDVKGRVGAEARAAALIDAAEHIRALPPPRGWTE